MPSINTMLALTILLSLHPSVRAVQLQLDLRAAHTPQARTADQAQALAQAPDLSHVVQHPDFMAAMAAEREHIRRQERPSALQYRMLELQGASRYAGSLIPTRVKQSLSPRHCAASCGGSLSRLGS